MYLNTMMMFMVTLVSLAVHVYSTEYMRGDRRYTHFFAALVFVAQMVCLLFVKLDAKRRMEFIAGRTCARRALAKLGIVKLDSAVTAIKEMFSDERNVEAAKIAYEKVVV